jgi:hypothetical protein
MDRRTRLYQPLDFFAVRAPLLRVERYLELSASASAPASQAPASTPAVRTRTRPDMGWLLRLVLALEARPEVRRQLRCAALRERPTPSLEHRMTVRASTAADP